MKREFTNLLKLSSQFLTLFWHPLSYLLVTDEKKMTCRTDEAAVSRNLMT